MTEGITEMEPSQRRLLQLVYDHLVRTGKWPPTRYVRVEMRDHGRLEDICREVGKRLIVCGTDECRPEQIVGFAETADGTIHAALWTMN